MRIMTMDDFFDAIVDDIFDKLDMNKDVKPVKKEEPVKTDSSEKTENKRLEKTYKATGKAEDSQASFELKPCPFCGNKAQLRIKWTWQDKEIKYTPYKMYSVSCQNEACGICTRTFDDQQKAVKAWNKRVSNATSTEKQRLETTYLKNIAGYGKVIVDFAEACEKLVQKD